MTITHTTNEGESAPQEPKKKAKAPTAKTETAPEQTDAEPSASETPAKPRKAKRSAPPKIAKGPAPDMTLQDLSEQYIAHLAAEGKSHGTCFSYQLELNTACRVMGGDTKIADLTERDVHKYFNCGPVTLLKSGRPKAKPSVDKSRRVLRLALVWAASKKWIEKAPLPE